MPAPYPSPAAGTMPGRIVRPSTRAQENLASLGSDLVLCMMRADKILEVPVLKADWLVCLWRRAADVFMQDAGD